MAKDPEDYQRDVRKGLDQAFGGKQVYRGRLDLQKTPLIVFSDHHRGTKDGADDFWRCEDAYNAALGYYLELGFTLILLGDVEELWEGKPKDVTRCYPQTTKLEKAFFDNGRLLRVFGNHDDL